MDAFDKWWTGVYSDKPRQIYRQCYDEGYAQGYADGVMGVRILRYVLLGAFALGVVVLLGKAL
jgi:hypothetical protein